MPFGRGSAQSELTRLHSCSFGVSLVSMYSWITALVLPLLTTCHRASITTSSPGEKEHTVQLYTWGGYLLLSCFY